MERRSLFCRDIIKGFALLTDVFFLLLEHIEIMQIIINCHVMNSQAQNEGSVIWWRWTDRSHISYSVMCAAEFISMQSSFVISSLSHISIELSGTDMWDCPEQTSAHTCTHMYKHTQADIHAHAGPVGAQTLTHKKRIKRECTVCANLIKTRRKKGRDERERERCVCVRVCVLERGRETWDRETRVDRHWFPQVHVG